MLNHFTTQRKPQIIYSLFNFLFWNIKYLFVIGCKCLYKIYCQLNRLSIPCRRPFEGSVTEIMPLVCFQYLPSLIGWLWFIQHWTLIGQASFYGDPSSLGHTSIFDSVNSQLSKAFLTFCCVLMAYLRMSIIYLTRSSVIETHGNISGLEWTSLIPSMCCVLCCGSTCGKYSARQHCRVNTELTDTVQYWINNRTRSYNWDLTIEKLSKLQNSVLENLKMDIWHDEIHILTRQMWLVALHNNVNCLIYQQIKFMSWNI